MSAIAVPLQKTKEAAPAASIFIKELIKRCSLRLVKPAKPQFTKRK